MNSCRRKALQDRLAWLLRTLNSQLLSSNLPPGFWSFSDKEGLSVIVKLSGAGAIGKRQLTRADADAQQSLRQVRVGRLLVPRALSPSVRQV